MKRISQKLDRIDKALLENKENLSKLQLEQMVLAVRMFQNEFYGLPRSTRVMNKDEHDTFLIRFDQLRQTLFDHLDYFC